MGGWWGGGRVQEGERMGGYVNSWGMKSEWVEDGERGGGEEGVGRMDEQGLCKQWSEWKGGKHVGRCGGGVACGQGGAVGR